LIPGGILKIHCKLKGNERKLEKLKKALINNNFYINKISRLDFNINGYITLCAFKQKRIKSSKIVIDFKKIDDISIILKQNKDIFKNNSKLLNLGYKPTLIEKILNNDNGNKKIIEPKKDINELRGFPNDFFDAAIVTNTFEYITYSDNKNLIRELHRVTKANSNVLIIIPEKKNYYSKHTTQIFDKGIIIRILDELNVKIEWVNLSTSFKMIQILIKFDPNFPPTNNNKKIVLLGNYALRYTFLNNARWDSQARAFKNLGFISQIIDIRDHSYEVIIRRIKTFKPELLWVGGKDGIDFLKAYADFFKTSRIKVIYWLWDIITPSKFDFNKIIDVMFITSKGEIDLYKQTYNLEKVYYMPVAIMPEIIHRNNLIKEIYEIGFSGQLSDTHPYYKERKEMLDYAGKFYDIKIFKNLYNNLPEHYSKCKIIFGGTPYFKDLELYASNRPFVAMACGCCFITNYFKGLEKLVQNEKHLLWYKDKSELKMVEKKK
jgi:hypothetical protein